MNRTTAFRTLRTVSLCLLVATGLLVAGCDSGGSNGGGSKSGAVTAKVKGGEASGTIAADFTYDADGETCTKAAFDEGFETPGNKEFDPTVIPTFGGCSVENATQWRLRSIPTVQSTDLRSRLPAGAAKLPLPRLQPPAGI